MHVIGNPGLHSQKTSRFAILVKCDHLVCFLLCDALTSECLGAVQCDCGVSLIEIPKMPSLRFHSWYVRCGGPRKLALYFRNDVYLQLENGEVGKQIVRAVIELLGEVVVQNVEVLRVVPVNPRDELLNVLGSRRWRDPLRCAGGFGGHVVRCVWVWW